MTRPSVKAKRTEEILQAYERCIALYGVEGATLQKIAQEAGIARPLLRHHVGNSDDLLEMALKRFTKRSEISPHKTIPNYKNGQDFIRSLFRNTHTKEKHNDTMIAAAFIYAAQTHPNIKKKMKTWLTRFIKNFSAQMQKLYPKAETEKIENITAGIIGIYFNIESLTPLGTNKTLRKQSRQAALYLLKTLEQKK